MPKAAAVPASRLSLKDMAHLTPASRDRTVDLLRAGAIAVVVLWHWVFSITHRNSAGRFTMPNPLAGVPGSWALTWVLQVMPLFFVIGGYADLAAWTSAERRGDGAVAFLRSRARRLLLPPAAMVAAWTMFEIGRVLLAPGSASVLTWGRVVFVPLWFLAIYAATTALVPLTVRLHRRFGWRAAAMLVAAPFAVDRARMSGAGWLAIPGMILVFVACHQLGYLWRDRQVTRPAALAAGAAGALALLTTLGGYDRSMVATPGSTSNMFPTTVCIAVLAAFQLGLVLWARPALERLAARRRLWVAVVGVNGAAMTIFTWHMTAWMLAALAWERVVGPLGRTPDAGWWSTRPVWIVLPGLALAALVATFRRLE
ncbi:MAG: acyltransferase family protein, partial [Acidimicrobiales bacterium]